MIFIKIDKIIKYMNSIHYKYINNKRYLMFKFYSIKKWFINKINKYNENKK